eukprot:1196204-Prorocentrum_minimum.AAC.5
MRALERSGQVPQARCAVANLAVTCCYISVTCMWAGTSRPSGGAEALPGIVRGLCFVLGLSDTFKPLLSKLAAGKFNSPPFFQQMTHADDLGCSSICSRRSLISLCSFRLAFSISSPAGRDTGSEGTNRRGTESIFQGLEPRRNRPCRARRGRTRDLKARPC